MPAAAVIPAPIAYINVVAVKKPVVGSETTVWARTQGPSASVGSSCYCPHRQSSETCGIVHWSGRSFIRTARHFRRSTLHKVRPQLSL